MVSDLNTLYNFSTPQFLRQLGSKKNFCSILKHIDGIEAEFSITWSLNIWTQSKYLLEIVHAKFQVDVAIFAAPRVEKGIFAAFYSILIAQNLNSL